MNRSYTILIILFILLFLPSCTDPPPAPQNEPPTVYVYSPSDNTFFAESDAVVFRGSAFDPEDGRLPGTSLVWTSSLEGQIGTGEDFTRILNTGNHQITLTATDNEGFSASKSVSINVLADVSLKITEPKENSIFFVGDTVFCEVEVNPQEDADRVVWRLNDVVVDCSNGVIVSDVGLKTLSAEIEKEGIVWKTSVIIEVLNIVSGKVYPFSSGGVVSTTGLSIMFRYDGNEDSFEISADGSFKAKTRAVKSNKVEVIISGNDEYYPSKASLVLKEGRSLSGEDILKMVENETFGFVLVPYIWNINEGFYTGESGSVKLGETFTLPGSSNPASNIPFFWKRNNRLMSALEKDRPIKTFLSREYSDVPHRDSTIYWEVVEEVEDYLGLGKFFVPVPENEVNDRQRALRVNIRPDLLSNGISNLDSDNNVIGGVINMGPVVIDLGLGQEYINSMIIMHESLHVLGIGHTCQWSTLMGTPGSTNCAPGVVGYDEPSIDDVIHFQLLYLVRQFQHDNSVPFGIEEAYEAINK